MCWHCEGLTGVLGYRCNLDNINSQNFVSTCSVLSNKTHIDTVKILSLEEESSVGKSFPPGKRLMSIRIIDDIFSTFSLY